jgi:CYTH domain
VESEELEVEVKLSPPESEETILGPMRELLPPGWQLVRDRSYTVTDTYFDFEDSALAAAGATLRLRSTRYPFKERHGYRVQLKLPHEIPDEWARMGFLGKMELRSDLSVEDILGYAQILLPSRATRRARAFAEKSDDAGFVPLTHIVTQRQPYTVFAHTDTREPAPVFYAFFETCVAIDPVGIELPTLIETGGFPVRGPLRTTTFHEFELEIHWIDPANRMAVEPPGPRLRSDSLPYAEELRRTVVPGCPVIEPPKVQRALDLLGASDPFRSKLRA